MSLDMRQFVRKHHQIKAVKIINSPELQLLERWAFDLIKMAGKFGSHLTDDPESIYKYLPILSPEKSVLRQRFADKLVSPLHVSGFSQTEWDDNLARVALNGSVHDSKAAAHIAVSALHFAVADDSPDGIIQVWNNVIFKEHLAVKTGEPICAIALSHSGEFLGCYGLDNTFVWRMEDGAEVMRVSALPRASHVLCLRRE